MDEIEESLSEVKQMKEGKKPKKTLEDLLNEKWDNSYIHIWKALQTVFEKVPFIDRWTGHVGKGEERSIKKTELLKMVKALGL